VGAIARTTVIDGSLTVSVQNRVLGIRPITIVPEVQTQVETTAQAEAPRNTVSSTAQQTVQRAFISQDQNSACNTLNITIASSTIPETRSPSTPSNPCGSAKDDAQILKILGEDAKPNQSRYFIHPSVELAVLKRTEPQSR
ncbi:MAG: hypothetical protein LH647_11275, partial [Leptolyngbyaceae cyanobacterium CAN_BIN12]|nr:hypothetical protein [Leptolyngbyaceae cyanobacterium CAN_BIN12]